LPPGVTAGYRLLLRTAEAWQPVEFPLKGADVVAAGIPAGPRVGELLARVERWWEAGDFRADRAACLARLNAMLADVPVGPL
jgi:poly(A) polymerase